MLFNVGFRSVGTTRSYPHSYRANTKSASADVTPQIWIKASPRIEISAAFFTIIPLDQIDILTTAAATSHLDRLALVVSGVEQCSFSYITALPMISKSGGPKNPAPPANRSNTVTKCPDGILSHSQCATNPGRIYRTCTLPTCLRLMKCAPNAIDSDAPHRQHYLLSSVVRQPTESAQAVRCAAHILDKAKGAVYR